MTTDGFDLNSAQDSAQAAHPAQVTVGDSPDTAQPPVEANVADADATDIPEVIVCVTDVDSAEAPAIEPSEEAINEAIAEPTEEVHDDAIIDPSTEEAHEAGEAITEAEEDKTEYNVNDTEEEADEIGVSGVYDAYGREILRNVFENRLRLAPNSVKLAYGKLKNELLSYADVKRRYVGKQERFYIGSEWFFIFGVGDGVLEITTADASAEVKREKDAKSIKTALDILKSEVEKRGLVKKDYYVPTAYAERYPFNPEAVLAGYEEIPPEEDAFNGREYEPIEGELTKDIIAELMGDDFDVEDKEGKEKLDALRQQATTIKGAVALTEPIVYFYNAARTNENNIAYVTLQQVLNDKFLGKMLPQQFFAVAEGSERIETLNLLSIKQAASDCDENPNTIFVTQASARLLIKDDVLKRLIKNAKTENGNLVLAFDCALLEALGDRGLAGIRHLAENDIKIMIDNTENAGLRVLTEYNIDYLRFDARYYKEEDEKKTAHLDMVLGYAKVQGIKTAAIYVNSVKEAKYLLSHGVENIEGDLVGSPVRIIHNAIKDAKRLPLAK
ncbi:MAG: EAL domain-containing protein [Bacteroides sp.]|nr:EAL domain-containing protein [Bacillota bacterium]MCM1393764.1 EAL domain-containing protein [[Eubacterium] siraeum]MCM1455079.1 EAL domain-containing protein [Bacteroides sp.]